MERPYRRVCVSIWLREAGRASVRERETKRARLGSSRAARMCTACLAPLNENEQDPCAWATRPPAAGIPQPSAPVSHSAQALSKHPPSVAAHALQKKYPPPGPACKWKPSADRCLSDRLLVVVLPPAVCCLPSLFSCLPPIPFSPPLPPPPPAKTRRRRRRLADSRFPSQPPSATSSLDITTTTPFCRTPPPRQPLASTHATPTPNTPVSSLRILGPDARSFAQGSLFSRRWSGRPHLPRYSSGVLQRLRLPCASLLFFAQHHDLDHAHAHRMP